jgi:ABC-type glycerol-3-phosphate transport system permease component
MSILRRKIKLLMERGLAIVTMTVIALLVIVPVVWMLLYSLIPQAALATGSFPKMLSLATLKGYAEVFKSTPYLLMAGNSLFLALFRTVAQLAIAFLAAYALSRFKFPGQRLIFYIVLASMIIPSAAIMVPLFIIINQFGWVNHYLGIIVPFLASGYAIFFLRQFFLTVPVGLVEAATIDGCNEFTILSRIYLPVTLPSIFALGVILFVGHWNEYQWPLLVLNDLRKLTLPLAIVRFRNEGLIEWMPTAACCVMATAPVMILYSFAQRSFVETFANTAIKG